MQSVNTISAAVEEHLNNKRDWQPEIRRALPMNVKEPSEATPPALFLDEWEAVLWSPLAATPSRVCSREFYGSVGCARLRCLFSSRRLVSRIWSGGGGGSRAGDGRLFRRGPHWNVRGFARRRWRMTRFDCRSFSQERGGFQPSCRPLNCSSVSLRFGAIDPSQAPPGGLPRVATQLRYLNATSAS